MEREVRKVVTFGARRRWRRIVGLVIMELRLLGDKGGRLQVDAGGGNDVDDDASVVDALVLLVLLVGGGDKGVVGRGGKMALVVKGGDSREEKSSLGFHVKLILG
ncbi:hypothetical protein FCV25MIE_15561 [Fagus crenata]